MVAHLCFSYFFVIEVTVGSPKLNLGRVTMAEGTNLKVPNNYLTFLFFEYRVAWS